MIATAVRSGQPVVVGVSGEVFGDAGAVVGSVDGASDDPPDVGAADSESVGVGSVGTVVGTSLVVVDGELLGLGGLGEFVELVGLLAEAVAGAVEVRTGGVPGSAGATLGTVGRTAGVAGVLGTVMPAPAA